MPNTPNVRPRLAQTHTYVVLDVTPATFKEIADKLIAAHYDHSFDTVEGKLVIDMHGIALGEEPKHQGLVEALADLRKKTGRLGI